ncbi:MULTISPECIES: DUF3558 domain-containing protein [Actinoalloteichus]|uniref:DUF3558 family protein n=1 Tax=Actinoalloteichus fjordicus TaxID=1612552 RepID=A0AAC9LJC2_9PSEU|nr:MULTISPECIES: DUF3558 domain-containing protein [Actinoalloteichus]APU17395.1 putative DUF3558 family protein [Actinoalloteichus fjordicus]APU23479.1 putative DUF3558 family protein [Actinoalloteichus sp. GBA129-24]
MTEHRPAFAARCAVGLIIVLIAAACTDSGGGRAAHTNPPHLSAPLPSTPSASPPPRPQEISLVDVDPCTLLTEAQRSQLGFDRPPQPGVEDGFGDAATCSLRNSQGRIGARIALVTVEGVGVWTDDTAQVDVEHVEVADFPALVVRTPMIDTVCNVEVDVAEGQFLDVLYRDDGAQPPTPLDQLCAGAQRIAEVTITSLTAAR